MMTMQLTAMMVYTSAMMMIRFAMIMTTITIMTNDYYNDLNKNDYVRNVMTMTVMIMHVIALTMQLH